MGYFYALKDLDWPWDDQDEGRAIIVEADTPEGAIKIATERHIKQFPGAGGVTWSVARVDDFGFGDAEWSDDNIPAYEPFKNYHDVTDSLGSQIDRLANFIMAEIPGEPSQSEGAVDTAIRWMRSALEATRRSALVDAPAGEEALAYKFQNIMAQKLTTDEDGEILGVGPASFEMARLALAPTPSVAALQAEIEDAVAKAICDSLEADVYDELSEGGVVKAAYRQQARAAIAVIFPGKPAQIVE